MLIRSRISLLAAVLLAITPCLLDAQSPQTGLEPAVRADMNFLADDALHGRGSATRDEHIAALYAASVFQGLGLQPGADGSFIQKAPVNLPDRAKVRLARYEDTD